MKTRLRIVALCGVFIVLPISPEAQAQGVNFTGTWQVKSDKAPGCNSLKVEPVGGYCLGQVATSPWRSIGDRKWQDRRRNTDLFLHSQHASDQCEGSSERRDHILRYHWA
jgi:hypothetical protein